MIPYDMETLRTLNASGLALDARRFADLEFARGEREWALREAARAAVRPRTAAGAWAAALAGYLSPR